MESCHVLRGPGGMQRDSLTPNELECLRIVINFHFTSEDSRRSGLRYRCAHAPTADRSNGLSSVTVVHGLYPWVHKLFEKLWEIF